MRRGSALPFDGLRVRAGRHERPGSPFENASS